jgi:hypothetical protein
VPITFVPAAAGPRAATLTATVSSAGGSKQIPFSLSGTGQTASARLEGSPTVLTFGGTSTGASLSATVTFRNVGASALTIQAVAPPSPPFHAEGLPAPGAKIGAGESITIPMTFEPTAIGSYEGQVGLSTTGGNVSVALTGSAAAPGVLVIAPEALDYGPLPVGGEATRSFTVSNAGGVGITIFKSKPPTGGEFAATSSLPEDTTIAPGETLTETVRFAPAALGPASGAWLLNGEGSSTVHEVLFSGSGVAPGAGGGPPGTALVAPLAGQDLLSFNGARFGALLSGTRLSATRAGTVAVRVRCPLQLGGCAGTIVLRTRGAVRTSAHQRRAAVLTLASGAFQLASGHSATVKLHLSARARALLAREGRMRIAATLVSRGIGGARVVTRSPATLQLLPSRRTASKR